MRILKKSLLVHHASLKEKEKNVFFCTRHDANSSLRTKQRHACVVPPVPTVCIVHSQANNTHSLHYVCTGVTRHACLRFLLNDIWCKQDVTFSEFASRRIQKKMFFLLLSWEFAQTHALHDFECTHVSVKSKILFFRLRCSLSKENVYLFEVMK